jgi:cytochrome c peroxidase
MAKTINNMQNKASHRFRAAALSGMRFFALSTAVFLNACGGSSDSASSASTPQNASGTATAAAASGSQLSPAAGLGQKIFSDQTLSASGRQSFASCHDPAAAHAQTDQRAVQLGGTQLDTPGFRSVPSLRYLNLTPAFFFAADGTPTGGFNRDGRAQTLAQQAQRPVMAAHEMANAGTEELIGHLRSAAYAEEFRSVFGASVLDQADTAFERMVFALQQFQKEDPAFHPFDSKYDQFLAGKARLSDAELRGLALFNNPAKGNCAACHPSAKGADGSPPLFTDFTYDSLGVPRNAAIPATANPGYFDLGLCGPDRVDLASRTDLCGKFKVPTLRNVATRKVFFHNGVFNSLEQALRFYARRDTNPEEWYPLAADGSVDKFNDLPRQLRGNVNTSEGPYNRQPGMAPALTEAEINDVVQFLGTLNDGYQP